MPQSCCAIVPQPFLQHSFLQSSPTQHTALPHITQCGTQQEHSPRLPRQHHEVQTQTSPDTNRAPLHAAIRSMQGAPTIPPSRSLPLPPAGCTAHAGSSVPLCTHLQCPEVRRMAGGCCTKLSMSSSSPTFPCPKTSPHHAAELPIPWNSTGLEMKLLPTPASPGHGDAAQNPQPCCSLPSSLPSRGEQSAGRYLVISTTSSCHAPAKSRGSSPAALRHSRCFLWSLTLQPR